MYEKVVITGLGLVTPLGATPAAVLERIARGESASRRPAFDTTSLLCKSVAPIAEFHPEQYVEDGKSLRLMSRDAQLAVAAARLALADADLQPGQTYPSQAIALFGATGLTGMAAEEVSSLVKHSADAQGGLDLAQFGRVALKRVRPVLSFKILANMPICFVSIFANIRGPNGIYTPWEGQGVQAIAAGVREIQEGRVACALVGGSDVRTHEFAFVSLQQIGAFRSWAQHGEGSIPGEGAAFLVLEEERQARARGARIYARVARHVMRTAPTPADLAATFRNVIGDIGAGGAVDLVPAGDGDRFIAQAETEAIARASLLVGRRVHPKRYLGNLFAAAAAVQVALAATMAHGAGAGKHVLAHCFGHGSQQGALLLEGV